MTVRNRNTLNILVVNVGLHYAKASVADTDKAHHYPLAGRGITILAEGAGGDDGGKADGGAGSG